MKQMAVKAAFFFLSGAAILSAVAAARAQELASPQPSGSPKPALTAEQIVARMQEKNRERELALHKFQGTRHYHVEYNGFFGHREGEAVVRYNFASPDKKEFEVVSQTGSKFIFDHVIKGLMEGEKEAASEQNRRRTALSPANYDFILDEAETAREASLYVLNVIPKNDNKFLYRGKIWVDAGDFAVARIEAEPAKTPSFWVKKTEVRHRYEKVGDFWLPLENKSDSVIRLGGHALLSIEYKDYKLTEIGPLGPSETVRETAGSSLTSASNTALR